MPTTPHYALRYPLATDPADVPVDMGELAADVDAAIWGVASAGAFAGVATTVAGLGTPSAGKIGVVRLLPTTYNAGGVTALPAAVITVGDTTDFPTSGVLSTPNGDIAYTGKTGTTFTGCTGGVGTMSANVVIQLKTGTPVSGSYESVALIYDAVVGKWISISSLTFNQSPNTWQANSIPVTTWTDLIDNNGNNPTNVSAGFNWRARDAAGLKPQVRVLPGRANKSTTAVNGQFRPSFRSGAKRAAAGAVTMIGGDANAATGSFNIATTPVAIEGTPWGSIPAYTVADIFYPGLQGFVATVAGENLIWGGHLEVRWIG